MVGPPSRVLLLCHLPTRHEGDKDASCLFYGGSKVTTGLLLEALPPQGIVGSCGHLGWGTGTSVSRDHPKGYATHNTLNRTVYQSCLTWKCLDICKLGPEPGVSNQVLGSLNASSSCTHRSLFIFPNTWVLRGAVTGSPEGPEA